MGIPLNKALLMIAFIIATAALSIVRLDVNIKYIMAARWSIPASSIKETSACKYLQHFFKRLILHEWREFNSQM